MLNDKIKKAKTIAKAFLNELPENEKWYQDRITICNACEYNTANIDKDKLSTKDKLKLTVHICPEGDHCTACGCCTHRKAGQKSEACGLVDLGMEPKWGVLEVESKLDKGFIVENLTPSSGDLVIDNREVIYDLGVVDKERVDFTIKVIRSGGLDVKSTTVGCKCTVAETEILDKNSCQFNIAISTKDLRKDSVLIRIFTVHYHVTEKRVDKFSVKIRLKVKK